jgi:hypothetical protein
VFRQTFVNGWGEALGSLRTGANLPLLLAAFVLCCIVIWLLGRVRSGDETPSIRKFAISLAGGLLLVPPSVGVLIWTEYYGSDLWRLYHLVSIPAAISVFSLVAVISVFAVKARLQNALIVTTCLVLIVIGLSRLTLQHDHFVSSANNKAAVLRAILTHAPEVERDTQLLVLNMMPLDILRSKHIDELKTQMMGSALYVLYEGRSSGVAIFCTSPRDCFRDREWAERMENTLVMTLDENLSLEIVEEPYSYFEGFEQLDYDSRRLYNPDAFLPPRAYTMLDLSNQ